MTALFSEILHFCSIATIIIPLVQSLLDTVGHPKTKEEKGKERENEINARYNALVSAKCF